MLSRLCALAAVSMAASFFNSPMLSSQSPARTRLDRLRQEIKAAHSSGDSATYLGKSRELMEFLHATPSSILQVMSAQAFGGDDDGALDSFEKFIGAGQSAPEAFQNEVFARLRNSERFKAVESRMRKNEESIASSSAVVDLFEPGVITEDVDYDQVTRRFYVSTVLKHEVLSIDSKGTVKTFAQAPDSLPFLALKIDGKRRRLWVSEVGLNGFASIPKEKWKRSTILIYDIDSGRLVRRVDGPPGATLGDMVLTPQGDALASDNDGGIYRIPGASGKIERLDSGEFISPQTPAVSSNGQTAYIPDYLRGVAVMNLRTKEVRWIDPGGHALNGIDGLYISGRHLFATQNGTSPERVVRFDLDSSGSRIESESVIERATATLGDPTHGVLLKGFFYYIANSGWDTLNDDGTAKPGSCASKAHLMKAPLESTVPGGGR